MIEVFAFEGTMPTDKAASWGGAALRDGARVWNPGTGRSCSEEDARRLIADGHLTALPAPVQVEPRYRNRPLIVAIVRTSAPYSSFLVADTGKLGGLAAHGRTHGFVVYVFVNQSAFDRYARSVIDDLLHRILFGEDMDDAGRNELARLGLMLHSEHPFLLATWVHLATHDEFVEEIARASLRGEDNVHTFEDALLAFRSLDADYELIYDGGVSEGGGMDLDVAANTFNNLHYIHRQIGPTLERDFPFLHRGFAPPRFQEMKAASAHITFSAGPRDRPLGERLARVVELRALQVALAGGAPSEIRANPRFQQAVRAVVDPGPQTVVMHRPLNAEVPEPVEPVATEVGSVTRSEPLVVLGFQEDVKDRAHRIGIRIGPKTHIWVSATDNGEGETPEGVKVLHEGNDFLFRPAVFTVERRVDSAGRESHCLLRMKFLQAGDEAVLTALPSFLVDGAYLVGVELPVRRISEDVLRVVGIGEVPGLSGTTLGLAAGWIRSFARACRDMEIAAGRYEGSRWLQPARAPKPTALARVIVALHRLGGEAAVPDLVDEVNALFDANVRTNNTRREVLNHPDLIIFAAHDSRIAALTALGQAYAISYLRAGGEPGQWIGVGQ